MGVKGLKRTLRNSQKWSEGLCEDSPRKVAEAVKQGRGNLEQAGPAVDRRAIDCHVLRMTLFM